jgi:hypothetical protein
MTRRPVRAEGERIDGDGRNRGDRGVAAVEFALVLPLLVILLFGIVGAGLVYFDHIRLQSAARDGARAGALVPADACRVAQERTRNVGDGTTECLQTSICPGTDSSVTLQLVRRVSLPLLGDRSVGLSASAAFSCLV